ncbi:MAG TPA: MlaD family protein [Solirubrobacteraceae bacterium]|jgi:phospholipid/cholesterol/gamma-HCH transport system substrate-binding protein|nr:MlaD family protein [Solirubrobacteraceae bacterium]
MSGARWWRRRDTAVSELQKRTNPVRTGIVFLIVLLVVVYFGFAKHIPFKHGYRLNAVFSSAVNVRPKSPVRIAGVNVGAVTSARLEGSHVALVTMEIEGKGLPIHSDATLKIRPKIFLEGNWFVELQPGSPSAPALPSGSTLPVTQTSDPVQLDQVLDALNTDTRANLQTFLVEYGAALTAKPTPAEDAEQSPEVQGLNGAQALNKAYRLGPEALRDNAIISQALAGTETNDLYKLFASIERVSAELDVHEQALGELVGHFDTFLHSIAAQAPSVRAAVRELPAALHGTERGFAELQNAAPSIRTFALDLVPGVEQIPPTSAAAFPWIEQLRAALKPSELGGVAAALRTGAPEVAALTAGQVAFQPQFDDFNQCLSKVFYPAIKTPLQDGTNTSGVEAYKEFWYSMAGVAGISQNFDGNGAAGRFITGGAGSTILSPPATVVKPNPPSGGSTLIAQARLAPEGTSPRFSGVEPPYKPLVPCYTQKPPEVNGRLAHGPADGGG